MIPNGKTPNARGQRTRHRIAEALVSLIEETEQPPTAKEVASRAGVSLRLVFHHFQDMNAIYTAAMGVQFDRHWRQVRPVPVELSLRQRIEWTVRQRAELFDAIGALRRTATLLAERGGELAIALTESNKLLRNWLGLTFGAELDAAERGRRELLDALDVTSSFETWQQLRRQNGLSPAVARRVVVRTLSSLLAG